MSDIATLIADMVRSGVDPDLIGRTAAALAEREPVVVTAPPSETSGAARTRRWRERHKASQSVTSDVTVTEQEGFPHTPSQENPSPKENPPKGGQKKRGSRLPDDFAPDIEWAVSQGLSRRDAESQAQRFRDYWLAKPGAAGVKLDWPATWRNWVRRHADRAGVASTPVLVVDEARWKTRLTAARQKLQWSRKDWGPMPREPGCLVPADLLQDGDGVGWSEWQQVA